MPKHDAQGATDVYAYTAKELQTSPCVQKRTTNNKDMTGKPLPYALEQRLCKLQTADYGMYRSMSARYDFLYPTYYFNNSIDPSLPRCKIYVIYVLIYITISSV